MSLRTRSPVQDTTWRPDRAPAVAEARTLRTWRRVRRRRCRAVGGRRWDEDVRDTPDIRRWLDSPWSRWWGSGAGSRHRRGVRTRQSRARSKSAAATARTTYSPPSFPAGRRRPSPTRRLRPPPPTPRPGPPLTPPSACTSRCRRPPPAAAYPRQPSAGRAAPSAAADVETSRVSAAARPEASAAVRTDARSCEQQPGQRAHLLRVTLTTKEQQWARRTTEALAA